jgi:hypothetical protein
MKQFETVNGIPVKLVPDPILGGEFVILKLDIERIMEEQDEA